MNKILIVLLLFLTGCVSDGEKNTFSQDVDEYILEENIDVIERINSDEVVLLFSNAEEIGMIQILEKGFEVITETVPKEGSQVELLHIGDDYETYFGIVFRDEDLFTDGDRVLINLVASTEVVEFDISGEFSQIMVQYLEQSLTSCAAEKITIFNGDEEIYNESLVPV